MPHVILGTAGHIDHGKTSLVKALTGVDTDRLKEEKERGLTIDLGFAHFGDNATIVDVPGHEKFVRNMVAGVSTIDIVLFVVAADDGIMPQTREHFDILSLLQVRHGIIVITKIDLVDDEWRALIEADIRNLAKGSFLEKAPIFCVSTLTGQGIPELKAKLQTSISEITRNADKGVFWMPVDRTFTMKGFGTVATGSVLSGSVSVGDTIELLPQKIACKIRGLQKHGKSVASVAVGDRAAINLQSVEKTQISRGDVIAAPNYFTAASRFDARLRLLKSAPKALSTRSRVRVHVGTTEVMARLSILKEKKIERGQTASVQLNLEQPIAARRLDAFVIRQYSPTITIGGGVILNANAPKRKLSDPKSYAELKALEQEEPTEVLESMLLAADVTVLTFEKLASELAVPKESIAKILADWQQSGRVAIFKSGGRPAVLHQVNIDKLQQRVLAAIKDFYAANPFKAGLPKAALERSISAQIAPEVLNFILGKLKANREITEISGLINLYDYEISLSPELQKLREKISRILYEEAFLTSPPEGLAEKCQIDVRTVHEILNILISSDEIIRADENIFFHKNRVDEARQKLVSFLQKNGEISVGQFKDLLNNTSRKYAVPLINYFDGSGVTVRQGDIRVLDSETQL